MFKKREKFTPNNLFQKNRKGQFFIIAAVIIIVAIVSIATISNYTKKEENIKLYDLGKELGIESQYVLDYGTYSELPEEEMKALMERFVKNYADYIGEDKNIYFIFGNSKTVNLVIYQKLKTEEVRIDIGEGEYTLDLEKDLEKRKEFSASEGEEITDIKIIIGGVDYKFKLKPGENFYFVIWQEIGKDKIVITNADDFENQNEK